MSQLSPEARRLIAETKHLDDPSPAQRAALRARLDASWKGPGLRSRLTLGKPLVLSALTAAWLSYAALQGWLAPHAPAAHSVRTTSSAPQRVSDARTPVVAPADAPSTPVYANPTPSAQPLAPAAPPAKRPAAKPRVAWKPGRAPRLAAADAAPAPAPGPAATTPPEVSAQEPSSVAPTSPPLRHANQASQAPIHKREQLPAFDPLDDELALVGAAQEALQQGRPTRALGLVQQHAFRFPRGALTLERRAVHILALCALGRRAAAHAIWSDLVRSTPDAPVRRRLEADCGF